MASQGDCQKPSAIAKTEGELHLHPQSLFMPDTPDPRILRNTVESRDEALRRGSLAIFLSAFVLDMEHPAVKGLGWAAQCRERNASHCDSDNLQLSAGYRTEVIAAESAPTSLRILSTVLGPVALTVSVSNSER